METTTTHNSRCDAATCYEELCDECLAERHTAWRLEAYEEGEG